MIYQHIVIIDNEDTTSNSAVHYNNYHLCSAIQQYRGQYPGKDGVCLAYYEGRWVFIGYLRDIVA